MKVRVLRGGPTRPRAGLNSAASRATMEVVNKIEGNRPDRRTTATRLRPTKPAGFDSPALGHLVGVLLDGAAPGKGGEKVRILHLPPEGSSTGRHRSEPGYGP